MLTFRRKPKPAPRPEPEIEDLLQFMADGYRKLDVRPAKPATFEELTETLADLQELHREI